MSESQGSDVAGAVRTAAPSDRPRLRGWKEIGRHFGVDERTAKRWEVSRGMPVHRLPGEARAPVFAFAEELDGWVVQARPQPGDVEGPESVPADGDPGPTAVHSGRRAWLLWLMLLLAVMSAGWLGVRAYRSERLATERTGELERLATGQVAALNDQLDSPPGTVAVRADLAGEAVRLLDRIAADQQPEPALVLAVAEAWRRLAVLQNSIDRPSLRDRPAASASLGKALALLESAEGEAAAGVRARVQVEAARQAGGAGGLADAEALLRASFPVAAAQGDGDLARDWWLARAEVSGWAGDHRAALDAARKAHRETPGTSSAVLRHLKARDLEAEALYYLGDVVGAERVYRDAMARAEAAVAQWPTDSRFRWALLRQRWNLGSTLVAIGQPAEAARVLGAALSGWEGLARADPSDAALVAWVMANRLSYGQALEAGGNRPAAIAALSAAVAERRTWHQARPGDADRRRMLVKGLLTLGDVLGRAGRQAEGCLLLAEADRVSGTMRDDAQLTGFDRSETLRLLEDATGRYCAPLP